MTQPDLERVRGNIAFLRSAADYFGKRPTNGEDMAHWANTFDAQNCHAAADTIEALIKERDEARAAIERVRAVIEGAYPRPATCGHELFGWEGCIACYDIALVQALSIGGEAS